MSNINHLNHSSYECKYHIMFTPKYRKKELFGVIRKQLQDVFLRLARPNECEIVEGYIMKDHVHMLISIPPKHLVSHIVGLLKDMSSIWSQKRWWKAEEFCRPKVLGKGDTFVSGNCQVSCRVFNLSSLFFWAAFYNYIVLCF